MKMRFCLACAKELKGRSDKKFCDAQCKSFYHNTNRPAHEYSIQRINSSLRRNRSLLAKFCPSGKSKIEKIVLEKLGYRFDLFTHIHPFSTGTYYFCYDYGYLPATEKGVQLMHIVYKQEYMEQLVCNPWECQMVKRK